MQEPNTDTTPAPADDAAANLLAQIRGLGASSDASSSSSSGVAPLGGAATSELPADAAGSEAPAAPEASVNLGPIDADTADYITALEARIAELEGHPGQPRAMTGDGGNPVDAEVVAQVPAGDPWGATVHIDTREPTEAAAVDETHTVVKVDPIAPHLDRESGEPTEAAEVTPQVPVLVGAE